jgi:hypothetical protein
MTTCKNCETAFEGKFCPACGQKADVHRFTIPHLVHEIFHAVTHTDKGILFLTKEMFLRPGKTTRAIIDGKRKRFFNPFTFLLIMMALQVFVSKKTHYYEVFNNTMQEVTLSIIEKTGKSREQAMKELKPVMDDTSSNMEKVLENNKLLTFLFIPVLALLTWLFFRKSGLNYAENLVFNVLIAAETTLFFFVIAVIPFLFNPVLGSFLLYGHLLATIVYSFIGYRQLFGQGWGKVLWKGTVIQILYFFISAQLTKLAFYFV